MILFVIFYSTGMVLRLPTQLESTVVCFIRILHPLFENGKTGLTDSTLAGKTWRWKDHVTHQGIPPRPSVSSSLS